MAWRSIDTAPIEVAFRDSGLNIDLGPWVSVRNGDRVAKARYRLPLRRYDIETDRIVNRDGAWWGEDDAPLPFVPTEWAEAY